MIDSTTTNIPAPFTMFDSFYRVNICLLWEHKECSPLLVTNVNKKKLPPFDKRQITFLQVFIAVVVGYISYIYKIHYIWLWSTFKILPRHGCISINRQFNSTMENNFAGIRACSLSYPRSRGKIKKIFST